MPLPLPKSSSMNYLGHRARPGGALTEILLDYGRILEIYHLGKQATEKVKLQ